jgi:hypothetical protein
LEIVIDKESTETSFTTKEAAYVAFVEYCKIYRLRIRTKDYFGKSMNKHEVEEDL